MNRRNRTMLRLCVLLLLLSTFVSASTQIPVTRADWQLDNSGEINRDILGRTSYWRRWNNLSSDNKLRFVWSVSLYGVDFLIMNEGNFSLWSIGNTTYYEVIRQNLLSDNFEWHVPRDDQAWYTVWVNEALYPLYLSCDWYWYSWFEPNIGDVLILYLPMIFLLIGVVVICVIVVVITVVIKRSAQG